MSASVNQALARPRGIRRRWWLGVVAIPALIAAASWWVTEPLVDHGAPGKPETTTAAVTVVPVAPIEEEAPKTWPKERLEGRAAKTRLLDILGEASKRIDAVDAYTATFRKQERMKGTLGPVQTLAMKVRHKPFAIYFKFLAPQEGKEVVYAEGHHDNKLIAHSGGGVARFLVPRLAVAPDHPLALADSRHPITEAGLAALIERLLHFRKMDLDDPDAVTILDRTTDASGRARLRSVHTHPHQTPDRPFARVEVLYDPDTFLPIDIRNYDWPSAGDSGELRLAEHYRYDDLALDAALTGLDFDPANPAYAFHRF